MCGSWTVHAVGARRPRGVRHLSQMLEQDPWLQVRAGVGGATVPRGTGSTVSSDCPTSDCGPRPWLWKMFQSEGLVESPLLPPHTSPVSTSQALGIYVLGRGTLVLQEQGTRL